MFCYLLSCYFYYFKSSILWLVNNNFAQPTATLLVGFGVTLLVNYQQIQINQKNREQDLEISQQNNEEEILQKYLEGIETLLLKYNLDDFNQDNQARNIARFKTLTVLRRLTFKPERHKSIILQFLYDAELITILRNQKTISKLNLNSCDFQKANLEGANLEGANLGGVNFQGVNFIEATLIGASLRGANLQGAYLLGVNFLLANLIGTNFQGAYLGAAYFRDADLRRANLQEAYLEATKLQGANLQEAYLYQTTYLDIKQLKLAKNWEKAIYAEAEFDYQLLQWIPKDKATNEAKIEEIRNLTEGIVQF